MAMARQVVMKFLALLLVPALLVACNPFGLRDLLEAATRTVLSIDPRDVEVPAGATLTFFAKGGVPEYTYSVSGSGSIDPATGEYTAPLTAGTDIVTVTDAVGVSVSTQVNVTELLTGLSISPSEITVVVNAEVQFTAVGGTGPTFTFAFQSIGSGSPGLNTGTGYYVAGSVPGTDQIIVTDFLGTTSLPATVHVVALTSAVNYDITSTAGLPASGVAGEAITGSPTVTVTNIGLGDGAAAIDWHVYRSMDAVLDGGDVVVKSGTASALPAGASADITLSGTWPAGPTGAGYLIATVAAADDTSPGDNSASAAFTLQPRPVDCHVPMVNHLTGTYTGQPVTGNFTVENQGTVAGSSTIYWYVYASVDTIVDGSDFLLQSGSRVALGAGASAVIGISSTWPTTPALYRLLVRVSAADDIDTGNDTGWTSQVNVTGSPPADIDYQTAAPTVSGTVAGQPMSGTFNVTNTGTAAGSQNVYWTVYRSDDGILDTGADPIADMGTLAALGAGASAPVAYDGIWPTGAASYTMFAVVSAPDDVDPGNNDSIGTFVNVTAPNVDYVVQAFSETSGVVAGDPIVGQLQVRNAGTSAGSQPVAWTVYLSEDATLDPLTDLVADAGTLAALGAGASSAATPFDGTWPFSPYPPWTWRLYFVVAAADEIDPSDNTSGTLVRNTVAPTADYDVVTVTNTGGTTAGYPLSGTFSATNLGPHDGTQSVPWRAYLSVDNNYDAGVDTLVDSGVIASPGLTVGSSTGPVAFSGTWPAGAGTWYLLVVLDAGDDVNAVNDEAAAGPIAITAPNVNYDVLTVTNTGGTLAGGPLAGEFTVRNIGTDPGSTTVYWIAYRSDDLTLTPGTDPVVDSGSIAALAAGATSAAIPFAGAWPSALVTKTYYLFVRVFASDDVLATDDTMASGIVTVNPPNIDYDVIVINNTGPLVAGGALGGTFQVQNIGTTNGASTLYWAVYRSLDLVFTSGVDPVVDSGSIPGGLTAGNSSNPAFAGTWPESGVPVTYYYFVKVYAADDIGAANDEQFSGPNLVAAGAPDYEVVGTTINGTGTPGAVLSGTNKFQIHNAAANPGAKTITWRAYASLDAVLGGSDTLLSWNTIGALGGGGTTGDIAIVGSWPALGSYYRIIVDISADDDIQNSNNRWVSAEVEVPDATFTEGIGNEDMTPPFPGLPNFGTIGLNQLVKVTGTMDLYNAVDNFRWTAGVGVTHVEIKIKWTTGYDDCDIRFWDTIGNEYRSQDYQADEEPTGLRYTSPYLDAGSEYYSAVYFWRAGNTRFTADPYTLFICGR
jgi:hypothetical protein